MKELPIEIYRSAQVRALDRLAIERHDIPGYTLMYRAGEASFRELRRRWPGARRILVLCGAGNNAGDGYVLARLAQAERLTVTVAALFDPEKLEGDAHVAWESFASAGGQIIEWDPALLQFADVVVDAMLGTGLTRPLTGRPRELVEAVNNSPRPVLALDIPTGLDADMGKVMGAAIEADATITFVGLKLGFYAGQGREYTGEIVFDDLGVQALVGKNRPPCAGRRISPDLISRVLPRRRRTAHKGQHGHVLLVGGNHGMPGGARLAAEAALRVGAGLVTVATRAESVDAVMAGRPEIMCHGVEPDALERLLEKATVVAVGPGLGGDEWAQAALNAVLASALPKVVDADALNLLAGGDAKRDDWVITPHPGEAARLLGTDPARIQADRFASVAELMDRYGGVAVLKGAGTLVARRGEMPWVCDRGNPGLAAAGMGDVLTGVIAGIAAQCGDLFDAARVGVLVHALAGDAAARNGERGLLAGELFPHLRQWVNHEQP